MSAYLFSQHGTAREEAPWVRTRRWVARGALVLVTLVLLEASLRFALRDITTTAQRSYFSERWMRSGAVQSNSLGFRERDFGMVPDPSVYRICMVGDSFLFGQGLPVEARLSNMLEARLNRDGRRFEVLNFGDKGANLPEHLKSLRDAVLPAKPDLVLLQWFINDADSEASSYPSPPRLLPWRAGDRFMTRHSALWSLAGIAFERAALRLNLRRSYWDFTRDLLEDEEGIPATGARDALRAFIETCREDGTAVGVILFPDLGVDLGDDYRLGFLMDRTVRQCRKMEVPCLDLRTVFRQVAPEQRSTLCLNWLDAHPSRLANALAGERVYDWLLQMQAW